MNREVCTTHFLCLTHTSMSIDSFTLFDPPKISIHFLQNTNVLCLAIYKAITFGISEPPQDLAAAKYGQLRPQVLLRSD